MTKHLNLLALSFAVLLLTGCASPASKEGMTTSNYQATKKFDQSVQVKTAGGKETGADGTNISDEDFKAALEASIQQSGLFKNVVQVNNADYELSVAITELDKPMFGLTFTVNMEAHWVLVKKSDKTVVMKKAIKSSATATFGDAAAAVTRLKLAVEGAAKNNIELGLREIALLSL